MEGCAEGGDMMSYCAFLYTEGREREMSSQGETTARPAAAGEASGTLRPWNRMCVTPSRGMVRRRSSKEVARPAPDESPVMTICDGWTGAWKEPGGGATSERYAISASRRAAGKVLWGASL